MMNPQSMRPFTDTSGKVHNDGQVIAIAEATKLIIVDGDGGQPCGNDEC